jgi:hypothetical protein
MSRILSASPEPRSARTLIGLTVFAATLCCLLSPAMAHEKQSPWMAEHVNLRLDEKKLQSLPKGMLRAEIERVFSPKFVGSVNARQADNTFQVGLLDHVSADHFVAQSGGDRMIARMYYPIITGYACGWIGSNRYQCYVNYSASTPVSVTFTPWLTSSGTQINTPGSSTIRDMCRTTGSTISASVTVSNAFGSTTRNTSFVCY